MKDLVGKNVTRKDMVDAVLLFNFNAEKALNHILNNTKPVLAKVTDRKEQGDF